MLKVNPVQSFKQMSKGQKVATVAATTVAAAGVASVVAAGLLGKGKVADVQGIKKVLPAIKEGYKVMGGAIAKAGKAVAKFAVDAFNNIKAKFAPTVEEVAEEIQTAAEEVVQ